MAKKPLYACLYKKRKPNWEYLSKYIEAYKTNLVKKPLQFEVVQFF